MLKNHYMNDIGIIVQSNGDLVLGTKGDADSSNIYIPSSWDNLNKFCCLLEMALQKYRESKRFKYKKKPIVVEAVQFDGSFSGNAVPTWYINAIRTNIITYHGEYHSQYAEIKTFDGIMKAEKGDWIVRHDKGDIYPVNQDLFKKIYRVNIMSHKITPEFVKELLQQKQKHQESGVIGTNPVMEYFCDIVKEYLKLAEENNKLRSSIDRWEAYLNLKLEELNKRE